MGGHPYWYVVAYDANLEAALERLREREFRAGRYNPVMPFIPFPITASSPSPGAPTCAWTYVASPQTI